MKLNLGLIFVSLFHEHVYSTNDFVFTSSIVIELENRIRDYQILTSGQIVKLTVFREMRL